MKSSGKILLSLVVPSVVCTACVASTLTVEKPYFRWLFGGFGFQHSEASLTALMSDEFRDERALKSFAEIDPSFGRVYVGFAETSKEQMDRFADYYDRTFRVADTTLYAVPCAIQSFPERLDPKAYAEKVATNLDYLVKVRNCRKIRYYCLTNEQVAGGKWDYFRSNNQMDCYRRLNEELFFAFRRHGLDILLLATDIAVTSYPETEAPKSLKWAADEMNDYIGAFCSHWYVYGQKTGNLSLWKGYNDYFAELVKIALGRQKRYILGEWGFHQVYGKPGVMIDDVKPYWRCPSNRTETVLAKMEVGLAAMNQGAYACVNWSFCDYPDPWPFEDGHSPEARARYESAKCVWTPDLKYNKCGLFSWGTTDRDYSSCEEYYAMGYLAKLFRKGATVLPVKSDDPLLRSGAVLNPDQSVSVAVINRGEARQVTVDCSSFKVRHDGTPLLHQPLRRYVYEADNVPWSAFNDLQPASGTVKSSDGSFTALLPAKSMTFFTTDYVDRIPSAVDGVVLKDGVLSWTPSADAEHRYYRVYRDGRQVASTVATSCRVGRHDGKFSVVSVDRWGNSGIVQQERNVTK